MNKPMFISAIVVLVLIIAVIGYNYEPSEVSSENDIPKKLNNSLPKRQNLSPFPKSESFDNEEIPKEKWRALYDDAVKLWQRGKFEEALKIIDQSVSLVEIKYGKDHLYVTDPLYLKAEILVKLNSLDEAEANFKRVNAIQEKLPITDAVKFSYSLVQLAHIELERGNFEKAEEYTNQVISIYTERFGEDHPILANSYIDLAYYSYLKGNYKKAKERYIKVVHLTINTEELSNSFVPDSTVVITGKNNSLLSLYRILQEISAKLEEIDEFAKWRDKADDIEMLINKEKGFDFDRYVSTTIDSIRKAFDYMETCNYDSCRHTNTKLSNEPYQFTVEYTGSFRPMKTPSTSMLDGLADTGLIPRKFIDKYKHELLVKDKTGEYWMPVQEVLIEHFKNEQHLGNTVRLYVFFPGTISGQNGLWWIFMINEFK